MGTFRSLNDLKCPQSHIQNLGASLNINKTKYLSRRNPHSPGSTDSFLDHKYSSTDL